jgi:hypothetical protein
MVCNSVIDGINSGAGGIVATICLALQNSDNSNITNPIEITAAALVTWMTSIASSLHITDNINKLIEISGGMNNRMNKFIHETYGLRGDAGETADDKKKLDKAELDFSTDMVARKGDLLRLRGSAGRLSIGPSSTPPTPTSSAPPSTTPATGAGQPKGG